MIGSTPVLVVAKDAAFSLNFAVLDTYGALVTGAGHSVQVTDGSATLSGAVVAGKAVVNWPGYTTTGGRTLTASVLKNGAATSATTDTVAVTVGTAGVPAAVSKTTTDVGTASAGKALNTKVWANADVRLGEEAPEVTGGIVLTGKVTNAAGAGVAGVDVTIAGAGLQFNSENELYRAESITVRTNASGDYTVTASSNIAGKKTATVTAGTATKAQDVFFTTAAYNTGATLTITTTAVNDTVAPGTTVRATVKLVDKFGNAVKVANQTGTASFGITVVGPGFVSSVPTETNASGEAAVSVLLGSQDSGSLVFTATYDGDDTGTTLAAISATRTITIGAAAASASDQKLTVGSFKGFVAIYALNYTGSKLSAKVAGKWLVENNLSRFERVVRLTGAAIPIVVDLYIDGKFVRTENIVTK
jgi:hypothetical protein